jgi:hypothetical protein
MQRIGLIYSVLFVFFILQTVQDYLTAVPSIFLDSEEEPLPPKIRYVNNTPFTSL